MSRFSPGILFLILIVLAAAGAGVWVGMNKLLTDPAFCIRTDTSTLASQSMQPIAVSCGAIPPATQAEIVLVVVVLGAVMGVAPHTRVFRGVVGQIIAGMEKSAQENSIRDYFERYSGGP